MRSSRYCPVRRLDGNVSLLLSVFRIDVTDDARCLRDFECYDYYD